MICSFENALNQLSQLEKKLEETKTEFNSAGVSLTQRQEELAKQEKYLEKYQEEVKTKVAQLAQELSAKIQQLGLKEAEIEELAKLKVELCKQGLDLKTFLKLGKEFSHGSS